MSCPENIDELSLKSMTSHRELQVQWDSFFRWKIAPSGIFQSALQLIKTQQGAASQTPLSSGEHRASFGVSLCAPACRTVLPVHGMLSPMPSRLIDQGVGRRRTREDVGGEEKRKK